MKKRNKKKKKIEIPCAFFQNKWCHSTHLKLNNRSDGSSVSLRCCRRRQGNHKRHQSWNSNSRSSLICLHTSIMPASGPRFRFLRSAGVVNLTPFQPITILSSRLCKVSLFSWLLETLFVNRGHRWSQSCCRGMNLVRRKTKTQAVSSGVWKWGRRECHLLIVRGITTLGQRPPGV